MFLCPWDKDTCMSAALNTHNDVRTWKFGICPLSSTCAPTSKGRKKGKKEEERRLLVPFLYV